MIHALMSSTQRFCSPDQNQLRSAASSPPGSRTLFMTESKKWRGRKVSVADFGSYNERDALPRRESYSRTTNVAQRRVLNMEC